MHALGEDPNLVSELPMGIGGAECLNPFRADLKSVIDLKMKTGRKRHATGSTSFNKECIKSIRDKMSRADGGGTGNGPCDPRIGFLKRVDRTADRFAKFIRMKFGLTEGKTFGNSAFKAADFATYFTDLASQLADFAA